MPGSSPAESLLRAKAALSKGACASPSHKTLTNEQPPLPLLLWPQ